MAWTNEVPILMRLILNDLDSPQKYADSRLELLFLGAAQLMQLEVGFRQQYAIDLTALTITPDPTVGVVDEGFVNLAVLKSACILARGGLVKIGPSSISVTDGRKRIDTTHALAGQIAVVSNFCDAYEEARFQYLAGNSRAGQAIIGPYRVFMEGYLGWPNNIDRYVRGLY